MINLDLYYDVMKPCIIWNHRDPSAMPSPPQEGENGFFDAPHAGGKYTVTHDSYWVLVSQDKFGRRDRVKLTDWLFKQREKGTEQPHITSDVLEAVKHQPNTPARTRMDRVLRFLDEQDAFLGPTRMPGDGEMLGRSSSVNRGDLEGLYEGLAERGEIKISGQKNEYCRLTAVGVERLEKIASATSDSRIGFIAMWFGDKKHKRLMNRVCKAIEEGIEEDEDGKPTGFKGQRIDKTEHNEKIDNKIIADIRKSRFVVVDLTHGEDGQRGSVYYEAGFAHGLGLEVIFTCQDEGPTKVAFDTQSFNRIMWTKGKWKDLSKAIRNRIGATDINR